MHVVPHDQGSEFTACTTLRGLQSNEVAMCFTDRQGAAINTANGMTIPKG